MSGDPRTTRTPGGRRIAIAAVLLAVLIPALATLAPAAAPPPASPEARAVARRLAADSVRLRDVVRRLADPAWQGRGVGTAGIDSAAHWIADRFRRAGLVPAGDGGGWFQTFEVTTGVVAETPCELAADRVRVPLGDSLQPLGFSSNGTARARVVFAGYGITSPGHEWNDYEGLDARDAIVLVLTQEPGELDSTSRFDGVLQTPFADLRTKAINAREHGALGLLAVAGPRWRAGEPPRAPVRDGEGYMSSGLLAAWISQSAADSLLAGSGLTLAKAQEVIETGRRPHSFALRDSASLTVNVRRSRATTHNVVGLVPGRDTARTLVMGAHYDHLGFGGPSSLSPDRREPHVGADDNASGVSVVLATAEHFGERARRGRKPAHTLVFTAFSAEEMGLSGSSHFTDLAGSAGQGAPALASVEAMVNLDMVGRLRDNRLNVMGVGTSPEFPALLRSVNAAVPSARFDLKTSEDGYGPSDHQSFYKKNVPVLMLFTGAHADYHKPSDTWDKVHGAGLARVAHFAAALVESLDARPRLAFTRAKVDSTPGRKAGVGGGFGAYLGTIPDYMQTEGGVLLDGVRDGSPAAQAGLREDDVIVRFDGMRVDNIYDYMFALRTRKPGQEVRITVKRAGEEKELVATLGRRR
jgi:hypothetical protein